MGSVCIIPARGGSKRIPRKNIKPFFGKPIIAYSIEVAIQSGLFDEVMVSTDDDEIASVAKDYGATVPFRRSLVNSNDFSTLADVVNEVMDLYENQGNVFSKGCCILPTAPFITVKNLKQGLELLKTQVADSVRPLVRFSYPIQRALVMDSKGSVAFMQPEYAKARSQDLEPAYHDAGQFYWFRSEKRLNGAQKFGFEIDPRFVQDIDSEEDWKMAEVKFKMLK